MKNASSFGHVFTFGMPTFLVIGSWWTIGWLQTAIWTALGMFVVAVGAWLLAVAFYSQSPWIAPFTRSVLGVAMGAAWGLGLAVFGTALGL